MMTQTLALFLDAYRDLNSRKLFWITLILSAIVIGAFALVGVGPNYLSFAGVSIEVPAMVDPLLIYKQLVLSTFVIGIWLTWGAIVLALVSTGGIFPDLIAGGAIDLYLSKPISRLRLFITKYFTGLLFVTLQVAVFAIGCFIVMGARAHTWQPSVLLAIPLVVAMFSYLYAFSVLLGLWTRSAIAAILLTVVLWLLFALVQWTEPSLLAFETIIQQTVSRLENDLQTTEATLARHEKSDTRASATFAESMLRKRAEDDREELEKNRRNLSRWRFFHNIFYGVEVVIPKTTETKALLDRYLISDSELAAAQKNQQPPPGRNGNDQSVFGASQEDVQAAAPQVQQKIRSRSAFQIIGTSLLSEAVVLAVAAWIFCRRDY